MANGSKIGFAEWVVVFTVVVGIDILQFFLDVGFIGLFANRLIDIGVGLSLCFYFPMRGVRLTPARVASLLAVFLIELIPVIDAAPLWSIDVAYIFWSVWKEKRGQQPGQSTTLEDQKRRLQQEQARVRIEARQEVEYEQQSTEPTSDSSEETPEPIRPLPNLDLESSDHIIAARYHPKHLATGGEHMVYEIPSHPNIVAKVPIEPLKRIIDYHIEQGHPHGTLTPELNEQARIYISKENNRYQTLRSYFGDKRVLRQKKLLTKLPVTDNILNTIYKKGTAPKGVTESWGVATIQSKAKDIEDPDRLSLNSGHAEQKKPQVVTYTKVTDHLVLGKESEEKMTRQDFLDTQANDNLQKLLERAEGDEELRRSLIKLIEKAVSYTTETGEILDLAGEDNLIFSKQSGDWKFTLVDALYPSDDNMVNKTRGALSSLSQGGKLDLEDKNLLLNAVNYTRTINGLAELLGVDKRINLIPDDTNLSSVDILRSLQ